MVMYSRAQRSDYDVWNMLGLICRRHAFVLEKDILPGMGHSEVLAQAGLPVVAESLGVGIGYENRQLMSSAYRTNLGQRDTLSDMVFGLLSPDIMFQERPEILGHNGQDTTGKLRPPDEEAASLGPEFEAAWNKDSKSRPGETVVCTMENCFPGGGVVPGQYLDLATFILNPYLRCQVRITGPLNLKTGFLSDEQGLDVKQHVWTYKKQCKVRIVLCLPPNSNCAATPAILKLSPSLLFKLAISATTLTESSQAGSQDHSQDPESQSN